MMKIYILPISDRFQPDHQNWRCPPHNADYGVEQDFLSWLISSESQGQVQLTAQPEAADWCYLPVFWNRYYINNDWGQAGVEQLQALVGRCLRINSRIFTVCEYGLRSMYPDWDLARLTVATASRRGETGDIDIPLMCSPHIVSTSSPHKRYLAAFMGNRGTWDVREEMCATLQGVPEVELADATYLDEVFPQEAPFVEQLRAAYIGLAPRGHGGQSYRFYESMQLGTVPLHLGLPDTRPFQRWIHWEECSLFRPNSYELGSWLQNLNRDRLLAMGQRAAEVWHADLQYGRWCRYLIQELEVRL